MLIYTLVYYFTSEIGTTSLQGTKLLPPKCPLFGGSTVHAVESRGSGINQSHNYSNKDTLNEAHNGKKPLNKGHTELKRCVLEVVVRARAVLITAAG